MGTITLIPSVHISLDMACAWCVSSGTNLNTLSPGIDRDGAVSEGLISKMPLEVA